jgi:predicted ferric reductase
MIMPPTPPVIENEYESSINIQFLLLILIAMIVGLLAAMLLLPTWLPNMAASLTGTDPKVFWYLSRAMAFVSLTILWLSMALGLGITNKMARLWPGAPATFAIHEYVSLLGLAFAFFHALILLGDRYINFTVTQIFMPFSTVEYRPTWTGIGQLAFYLWLIVALSFYVRSSIGQKTWRMIHYLSFGLYIMGLAHGLFAGTDSTASWAGWYYWISGGSLLFLLIYRIVNTITEKRTKSAARRVFPTQLDRKTSAPVSEIKKVVNGSVVTMEGTHQVQPIRVRIVGDSVQESNPEKRRTTG